MSCLCSPASATLPVFLNPYTIQGKDMGIPFKFTKGFYSPNFKAYSFPVLFVWLVVFWLVGWFFVCLFLVLFVCLFGFFFFFFDTRQTIYQVWADDHKQMSLHSLVGCHLSLRCSGWLCVGMSPKHGTKKL